MHLTSSDLEELEKIEQMALVRSNPNFVQCKCGAVMEIAPGKVDYNQKDNDGKPIPR